MYQNSCDAEASFEQQRHYRNPAGFILANCHRSAASQGLRQSDIAGRTPPDIVRHGIGRAFQVASIFPSLTVHETMLAAVCADQRRASVLHWRFPLAETRDRAERAMELLGLASKRNRTLYTGITSDLHGRIQAHREGRFDGRQEI